ncbi:MAG: hypothetical protein SWK76_17170 [Actinomycetota bacterium]|nr:hypothetical protein [Actinomycetota bacterium]
MSGNNYTEINELRAISDDLMDAVAHINNILRHQEMMEENHERHRDLLQKAETILDRLKGHLAVATRSVEVLGCITAKDLDVVEEMFSAWGSVFEEAEASKGCDLEASETHGHWVKKHLQVLKAMFGPNGKEALA